MVSLTVIFIMLHNDLLVCIAQNLHSFSWKRIALLKARKTVNLVISYIFTYVMSLHNIIIRFKYQLHSKELFIFFYRDP